VLYRLLAPLIVSWRVSVEGDLLLGIDDGLGERRESPIQISVVAQALVAARLVSPTTTEWHLGEAVSDVVHSNLYELVAFCDWALCTHAE
jgi:hypothetical protein